MFPAVLAVLLMGVITGGVLSEDKPKFRDFVKESVLKKESENEK